MLLLTQITNFKADWASTSYFNSQMIPDPCDSNVDYLDEPVSL